MAKETFFFRVIAIPNCTFTNVFNPYAQSSSCPSSPAGRCGCPPRHRCSDPACRPLAGSSPRTRRQSSTRRRRRDRSNAARSAPQSARPETSPRRWRASSWSPGDSQGCFGCLNRGEIVTQDERRRMVRGGREQQNNSTCVFGGRLRVPGFDDQGKGPLEYKKKPI